MSTLTQDQLVDVYLELRPRLERIIARRVGSTTLAADLAQEMFFKIGNINARLATPSDAERYFLRVAMNASMDYIKIETRRREILEESEGVFQRNTPSPEVEVLARDEIREVEAALSELPAKCRDVLSLSRVEGLTHGEIAARLGVSKSLVEKYVVRALLHCRQRLSRSDHAGG